MTEQMSRLYQAAREMKGIRGQSALARALDTSPQTLHNWELRGISKRGLVQAQRVIGCSASWLDTGQGPSHIGIEPNVSAAPLGGRKVPLIRLTDVTRFGKSSDEPLQSYAQATTLEWLMTDLEPSDGAFALQIQGDSMLPDFKPGDRVVIDPAIAPAPGDFVVATDSDGESSFKKYRPRGLNATGTMVFELVPLNADYPSLRSDITPVRIIGTMIEHRTYRGRR